MKVYHGIDEVPESPPQTVLVMGTFDGVHLGHGALLNLGRIRADDLAAEVWAVTFDPHPSMVLAPHMAPPMLSTVADRLDLLSEAGMDACLVLEFDSELAAMTPEQFVERILLRCGVRQVVIGYDFTFGARRAGDAAVLRGLGEHNGFDVHVVPPVTLEGGAVPSSTKIRQLLLEGRVRAARELLGRSHGVRGKVVTGEGRGSGIGFPTANVEVSPEVLLPANGVYAVTAALSNGRRFPGAANLGTNPSFGGNIQRRLEVHLIDYEGESLVGREMLVSFMERLREERRFDSVEALARRIEEDVETCRAILSSRDGSDR